MNENLTCYAREHVRDGLTRKLSVTYACAGSCLGFFLSVLRQHSYYLSPNILRCVDVNFFCKLPSLQLETENVRCALRSVLASR